MPLLDANGQPSNDGRLVDMHGNLLTPDKPGQLDLPYQLTYASIIQGASQSFIALGFDEAMRHNKQNALAMRRDCRLMALLRERKEGTVSRKWQLEIDDETDPVQVAVRDGMTQIIRSIPRLKRIFRWLLEAIWYGRYGVQLKWGEIEMQLPAVTQPGLFPIGGADRESILQKHLSGGGQLQKGGDGETAEPKPQTESRKVTMPMAARPVNGDKLNALWDGTWLVAVYAGWEGNLRKDGADVRNADEVPGLKTEITWDNTSPVMVLNREWRERFLIHSYDPDDADYYEAERAGGVMGVGERSRIYWNNWIRQDYAAWIQDLFDRVGLGFITIKYETGNIKAQAAAEELAKKWGRKSVLAVPVSPDQLRSGGGVEVVDVPTAGALVVQQLIEYADYWIERRMVGQVMSSGKSADSGMGGTSGPAEMATTTKHQLLQSDAEELEETLTGSEAEPGLCSTIQKWTYPGTIGKFRVRFRFQVEEPDPQPKIDAIVALASAGVEMDQDEARKLTGQPKPKEGAKTFGGKTPVPTLPGAAPGQPGEDPNDPDSDDDESEASGEANGKAPPFMNGKA